MSHCGHGYWAAESNKATTRSGPCVGEEEVWERRKEEVEGRKRRMTEDEKGGKIIIIRITAPSLILDFSINHHHKYSHAQYIHTTG